MKTRFFFYFFMCLGTAFSQNFVANNGELQVLGNQLCNSKKQAVQLQGFSTHNLTFCTECVTYEAIKSNRDFWGANVVRATIYTDDWWNKNSYNKNPSLNKSMLDSVVKWTEELGIYCIVDWHILTQGNPNAKIHAGADDFFNEVSKKYALKKHVLYEICNEPNGAHVTWDTISDYANRIIPIIRKNDPHSVIIVGTPNWCQELDKVNVSTLQDSTNLMYAFHFYAATHKALLPMFEKQIHRIPVFVSEWGVCEASGNGNINFENSDAYLQIMKSSKLQSDSISVSWCLFSYGDKKEAASVLEPLSCSNKQWNNMSPTGFFIRKYLQN